MKPDNGHIDHSAIKPAYNVTLKHGKHVVGFHTFEYDMTTTSMQTALNAAREFLEEQIKPEIPSDYC